MIVELEDVVVSTLEPILTSEFNTAVIKFPNDARQSDIPFTSPRVMVGYQSERVDRQSETFNTFIRVPTILISLEFWELRGNQGVYPIIDRIIQVLTKVEPFPGFGVIELDRVEFVDSSQGYWLYSIFVECRAPKVS